MRSKSRTSVPFGEISVAVKSFVQLCSTSSVILTSKMVPAGAVLDSLESEPLVPLAGRFLGSPEAVMMVVPPVEVSVSVSLSSELSVSVSSSVSVVVAVFSVSVVSAVSFVLVSVLLSVVSSVSFSVLFSSVSVSPS